jgi:hypothetical protein
MKDDGWDEFGLRREILGKDVRFARLAPPAALQGAESCSIESLSCFTQARPSASISHRVYGKWKEEKENGRHT